MKNSFVVALLLILACNSHAQAQWDQGTPSSTIYYNSGNVGVGSSTPWNKLQIGTNPSNYSGNDLVVSNANGSLAIHNDVSHTFLYANRDIAIRPGGGLMSIYAKSDGNVGVGITSPSQKLDVVGRLKFRSDNSASAGVWFTGNDGVQNAFLGQTDLSGVSPIGFYHGGDWQLLVSNDGNIGAGVMAPTQKMDINGRVKFRAKGASAGAWFTGSDGVQNAFLGQTDMDGTSPIGFYHGGHWRFVVANSGNIGIGTTNPSQKLEVKGTVYSTEVKVDVYAGTGPDYVFEPTYNLPTLAETEAYIKANKHLPEVPSAKEMEANGINLSEMNMLLLKKVEELTLHLIELKKREQLHQMEIEELKKEVKKTKSK